jgi:hypothetical protein
MRFLTFVSLAVLAVTSSPALAAPTSVQCVIPSPANVFCTMLTLFEVPSRAAASRSLRALPRSRHSSAARRSLRQARASPRIPPESLRTPRQNLKNLLQDLRSPL